MLLSFIICFLLYFTAFAQELQSTNFRVLDPVQTPGSFSSSNTFRLFSNIAQIAIGTSTITNFNINAGFLFYPFASSPVVTATAGDAQVSLSWTASTGALGWVVSGYNVGQSTSAGGPYTYTSLGNVTSSTRTGLTNGTTYYFVIRAEDVFGNSVATSTQVSATPSAPAPAPAPTPAPAPSGGGGGGGGGGGFGFSAPTVSQKITLSGRAYPGANITIFKDGAVANTLRADINGIWKTDVPVVGGFYTFSIYATDSVNNRSLTSSFPLTVQSGQSMAVSDVVLPPTISTDKSQVKQGNDIKFFGYSFPDSSINVIINSEEQITDETKAGKDGFWDYVLASNLLEKGDHTTRTQTITTDGAKSPFSESIAFRVGDIDTPFKRVVQKITEKIVPSVSGVCSKNGDINNDKKINLIDFSIMLFFWNQRNPSNGCADINGDKIVNLFDFSITLYYWTG